MEKHAYYFILWFSVNNGINNIIPTPGNPICYAFVGGKSYDINLCASLLRRPSLAAKERHVRKDWRLRLSDEVMAKAGKSNFMESIRGITDPNLNGMTDGIRRSKVDVKLLEQQYNLLQIGKQVRIGVRPHFMRILFDIAPS